MQVVQNKALRLVCAAKYSTPIAALQVELGELPLVHRWWLLNISYALKCAYSDRHPSFEVFTVKPKVSQKINKPKFLASKIIFLLL